MIEQDKARFAELMTGLAEAFGDTMSKPGLSLRFEAMREHDIEDVETACVRMVQTRQFRGMPTVAELLDAMGARKEDTKTTARIEAAKVIELCGDPRGNEHRITDPVTIAVLNMRFGGLDGVGEMPTDKLPFFERDFIELYEAYADRGVADLGRAALESSRTANRRNDGPVRIGDVLPAALPVLDVEPRQ